VAHEITSPKNQPYSFHPDDVSVGLLKLSSNKHCNKFLKAL